MKTFMRRACSEALPTKKNLQKRKVLDNPVCANVPSEKRMPYMLFGNVKLSTVSGTNLLVKFEVIFHELHLFWTW